MRDLTCINIQRPGIDEVLSLWKVARYYRPDLGRFISKDPMGIVDGTNEFIYVQNNPVNWVDPLGFQLFPNGFPPQPTPAPQSAWTPIPYPPDPSDKDWPWNIWLLNGNAWPGFKGQDQICSVPNRFDSLNKNPCTLDCCRDHDNCYKRFHCIQSSWLPIPSFPGPCKMFNAALVICIAIALSNGCDPCPQ
jgi:hypothetical protein